MITSDYLIQLFPEFASVDGDRLAAFLKITDMQINPCIWKTKADYAQALLTAHILKSAGLGTNGPSGAGGPVTQEKIGDIEQGYGQWDYKEGFGGYATTAYGILFINLRKQTVRGPLVT